MDDVTHVDLGHAIISMVEPVRDPERLRAYNQWYEHDHAYGCMTAGPWAFSYRRFVATSPLKALRYPRAGGAADTVERGSFISFAWYLADRVDEHFAWLYPQRKWMSEHGRMNDDREHVSTSLYDFRGAVNRPGWPVPAEIALDHPYEGLVVAWLDVMDGSSADDVVDFVLQDWAPALLRPDGPAVQDRARP